MSQRLRPLPPDEFPMPAQKRLRGHNQLAPPTWKQSGECREEGTIGCSERRAWLLSAEHDELMSQNEQFNVLGELAAPATGKQPQYSREREIGEGKSISRCFQSQPPAGPRPGT